MSENAASRITRWAGHVWRMVNNRMVRRVDKWQENKRKTKTYDGKMLQYAKYICMKKEEETLKNWHKIAKSVRAFIK